MTTYNDAGYALIREYADSLDLRCPYMECKKCGNAPFTVEDKIRYIEGTHDHRQHGNLLEFLEETLEIVNNGMFCGWCPVEMDD